MSNIIQLPTAKVSSLELIDVLQKDLDECRQKEARSKQENTRLQKLADELTNDNALLREDKQRLFIERLSYT